MNEKQNSQILPEVLSPEWRRRKADAELHDLRILLADMDPEDRNRLMAELEKLSKGDLNSQERLSE